MSRRRKEMEEKPSFPPRMAGWEYQYERAEQYLGLLKVSKGWMETIKYLSRFYSGINVTKLEKDLEAIEKELKHNDK